MIEKRLNPTLKLSGLQIYAENITDDGNQDQEDDEQYKKLPIYKYNGRWDELREWNSPVLHDYSPTIDNRFSLFRDSLTASWSDFIIPKDESLPISYSQFIEEFQYALVTFFSLNSGALIPKVQYNTSCSNAIEHAQNIDIIRIFCHVRCILQKLLYAKTAHGKQKSILLAVLTIRTAIRQYNSYSDRSRKSVLNNLRSFLETLENFHIYLNKYNSAYTELKSYKTINCSHNDNTKFTLAKIEDILAANLDIGFYQIIYYTKKILHLTNLDQLYKFCEMYNLQLPKVYTSIKFPSISIEDKRSRFDAVLKFLCCALLSFTTTRNHSAAIDNAGMQTFIEDLFDIEELRFVKNMHHTLRFHAVAMILQLLKSKIAILTTVFISNQESISTSSESLPHSSSTHAKRVKGHIPANVFTTINILHTLEKKLLSTTLPDEEIKQDVLSSLEHVQAIWDQSVSTSHARTNFYKPRMSLLNKRISLINIKENDSEANSCDEIVPSVEYDADSPPLSQHLTQHWDNLSDDELRRKLNEKIMTFAQENHEGRNRLRTAKSFELLKTNLPHTDQSNLPTMRSRTSKGVQQLSSEEAIPIFFELEHLFDKNF